MEMTSLLEILKNLMVYCMLIGISIAVLIPILESRYYKKRKNNINGTRVMYEHENNPITEEEKNRLEILLKLMKAMIIISISSAVLGAIIDMVIRYNAFLTYFS